MLPIHKALTAQGGTGERMQVADPTITLQPQVTLELALSLHERATKAIKYDASSTSADHVNVSWSVAEEIDEATPSVHLRRREVGGSEVHTPSRRSFGATMIERFLPPVFRSIHAWRTRPKVWSSPSPARLRMRAA